MSDNHREHGSEERKPLKKEMSRRQFLSYTLGGASAFMAAGVTIPMLRFAVDPILQPKAETDFVKVIEENKITNEPKSFTFQIHQVDGWYESDPEVSAWIARGDDGKVFALSPVCKHLGCTINWNTDPAASQQYFCPCHGAHYSKDGKNLNVAPAPLDEYTVKIENGFVYLGGLTKNTRL
ncbi:ubiquinol-cytochrome c reductase iron-sulfur subunit [Paenibacillus turpanensis]|uniref:ubiquinol-cytochrome c reductase iron-sulfur subunit n=1 Tax=Paenibacillus turpanensis TaxID=2689078 RepID=UPI001FB5861F|nr:ubiquinol-cytochrome c reductase iron-sulfur subunit [Paenibacillus turpanensis]